MSRTAKKPNTPQDDADAQLNQENLAEITTDQLRAELKSVLDGKDSDYVLVPFETLNDRHDVQSTGLKHTDDNGRLFELCRKL